MTTGILVDVVMPQMGVSVSEGTITRWAKQVGDTIAADETIVEISTDKVDTEVPAPASGVVKELLAEEGETVPVNTRIAVIDTGGSGATAGVSEAPATPPSTPAERVAGSAARGSPRSRAGRGAPDQRVVHRGSGGAELRQPCGGADAGRAQPRYQRDSRHRHRRPGHEARRPSVHRKRWRSPARRRRLQRHPRCTTSRTSRRRSRTRSSSRLPQLRRPHRHHPRPPLRRPRRRLRPLRR